MDKPCILVVDDSVDYQRILSRVLKAEGYRVACARSAEEARRLLDIRLPDVAILDWNMPGESGVALARRVLEDPRLSRIGLILLTVNARPEEQVRGLREGGVNCYLTKPFKTEELLARLKALLRARGRGA